MWVEYSWYSAKSRDMAYNASDYIPAKRVRTPLASGSIKYKQWSPRGRLPEDIAA